MDKAGVGSVDACYIGGGIYTESVAVAGGKVFLQGYLLNPYGVGLLPTAAGGVRCADEEEISKRLSTNFMPDPDLMIRTGGELRISNYLLWQMAYSELYFCDTYWPDFKEEDLQKAILSYQKRQRRYGKTEEQIEEENTNDNE